MRERIGPVEHPTLTAEEIRQKTLAELCNLQGFHFGGHLWHVGSDALGWVTTRNGVAFEQYAIRWDAAKDIKDHIIRFVETGFRR